MLAEPPEVEVQAHVRRDVCVRLAQVEQPTTIVTATVAAMLRAAVPGLCAAAAVAILCAVAATVASVVVVVVAVGGVPVVGLLAAHAPLAARPRRMLRLLPAPPRVGRLRRSHLGRRHAAPLVARVALHPVALVVVVVVAAAAAALVVVAAAAAAAAAVSAAARAAVRNASKIIA